MSARVLVAGIGNIFLGDDGFGVEAARQLAEVDLPQGVQVADYGVSGMHLAYDLLGGYTATILLDTTQRDSAPGTIYVIELDPEEIANGVSATDQLGEGRFVDAHGMHPESVLSLLAMLGGEAGRVLLVGCEPSELEPGIGLTETVQAAVPTAVNMVRDLIGELVGQVGIPAQVPSVPTMTGEK
ncbi:MAG: hydrogenase maturation protease [Sciscionella sp.]